MTVQDIIRTALAGEYEHIEDENTATPHLLTWMNTLLADCYGAEQNSRQAEGKELLTEIPTVHAMTDEVPYNDMLVRYALPYGIEWKYAEQDLDANRAIQYRAMYEDAKRNAGGAVWL